MKYGFVYIWFDCKHKRYYIGCHWGTENDGYICSSNWMRDSYKRRKQDFKRRILKTNLQCRKETFEEEYRYLNMIKEEELGKRYYNLRNKDYNHYSKDKNKIVSTGEKISESKIGKKRPPFTEETKKRMSESAKNKPPVKKETKLKISIAKKGQMPSEYNKIQRLKAVTGKSCSEETKLKISIANKDRNISDEHKKQISIANTGRKHLNRKRKAPVTDIERKNRSEGQLKRNINANR